MGAFEGNGDTNWVGNIRVAVELLPLTGRLLAGYLAGFIVKRSEVDSEFENERAMFSHLFFLKKLYVLDIYVTKINM